MRKLAIWSANLSGKLARLTRKWGGTTLPGKVALKLWPTATEELAQRLTEGAVVLSATNGKTTTARLLTRCAEENSWQVCANSAGANLVSGVTAALLPLATEEQTADLAVFEVDEAALPDVVKRTQPKLVLLMNLFRDQLDRHGELELIAHRWEDMIDSLSAETLLVVNADDPALVDLAERRQQNSANSNNTFFYGIGDPEISRDSLPHAADVTHCRKCQAQLSYSLITVGHLGTWKCQKCGWQRPQPHFEATGIAIADGQTRIAVETQGTLEAQSTPEIQTTQRGGPLQLTTALPGLHNAYNAIAAAAAATALGIANATIANAIASTVAAFGRSERVEIDGRQLTMLLAKNPTGANENIHIVREASAKSVASEPAEPATILIALNDRVADGHDTSWIWDVDYELLLEASSAGTSQSTHIFCCGDRAYELGLRLKYADTTNHPEIQVIPALPKALDAAISATAEGSTIFALATYTATLELRAELTSRGATSPFWEQT